MSQVSFTNTSRIAIVTTYAVALLITTLRSAPCWRLEMLFRSAASALTRLLVLMVSARLSTISRLISSSSYSFIAAALQYRSGAGRASAELRSRAGGSAANATQSILARSDPERRERAAPTRETRRDRRFGLDLRMA